MYIKMMGARWEFLKNIEGTRILFDRHGSNIFSPLRGTKFKQHKAYSFAFFRLDILKKGTAIILTTVSLQILTRKRYNGHHCHFISESPPSP